MSQATSTQNMMHIPSHPGNLRYVERFVQRLADSYDLPADRYGDILLSLTEAVNNAILHGNRADERKKVLVRAEQANRRLAIVVEDEGNGFDPRSIPDPTAEENLTRPGGRGVFMMYQLCDSVRYRQNGRSVELRFKI